MTYVNLHNVDDRLLRLRCHDAEEADGESCQVAVMAIMPETKVKVDGH